jgi:peptide deformylase
MRAADGAGWPRPDRRTFSWDLRHRHGQPALPGCAWCRARCCDPVVTPIGTEKKRAEGSSVPGLRALVPRWSRIRYTGFDQYGDPIDRTVEGFHARVVQHECDHLIGKLYPMRVRDFTKFGFTDVLFPGLDAGQDD